MLNRILGKEIAFYIKNSRGLLIWALLFTLLFTLFSMVPLYVIREVAKVLTGSNEFMPVTIPSISFVTESFPPVKITEINIIENVSRMHFLGLLLIVYAVSVLMKSFSEYIGGLFTAAFTHRAIKAMRIDLFDKFMKLHQGFYHKHKIGDLISRSTSDLTQMQFSIATIIIGLIQNPVLLLGYIGFLIYSDWKLTLIVSVTAPIIIGFTRLFGKKVKKHAIRMQDATANVTSSYQESILCLKIIQGFGAEKNQSGKFAETATQLYKRIMHWSRWQLGVGPLMETISTCVGLVILAIASTFFEHTAHELAAIFFAFTRIYAPVKNLSKVNNDLKTLQGATQRVFGIMNTEADIKNKKNALEISAPKDSIEFNNVSFEYEPDIEILKNISFKVNTGEMVAFVGSTGAGKSTLVDLIPRFYDVKSGNILIDGIDVRDIKIESLRRHIGIVNQEVLLFHDTIASNISCGFSDIDMERVIKAAKAAHAHDFITDLPKGYDTVVGDRGTLLSGGQKQRISIARAVLMESSVLILDEVASALDAQSEELIHKSIDSLRGKCTIFVIAHRLSTIRNADRIFVIEKGEIVESGTHEELLAINGRFSQLYKMQFQQ